MSERDRHLLDEALQAYQQRYLEEIDYAVLTALWLRYSGVDVIRYREPPDPFTVKTKSLPWLREPPRSTDNEMDTISVERYDFREGVTG